MAIRLDISPASVVIYCTACPWWAAIAMSRLEAHTVACNHESLVHPGDTQAAKTAHMYRLRHAAVAVNVERAPDDSTHGNPRPARRRTANV